MSIVFPCDCGSRLQVPDHRAGQTIRCPSCGGQTQVPRLGEDPFSYSVEGAAPGEAGWALTAEDRARSQATKPLPKSTYQSARTSQAAEDETVPRGKTSRARARRMRQPGWSASFWFPFQQENKFAFVAWAIGFVFFALMMSVPVISMRLYVGRIFLLLFAAGYFFHFLSEIVRSAAVGDRHLPETDVGDEVMVDAVNWWLAVLCSLAPWWGMIVIAWWFQFDLPLSWNLALLFLGMLYAPMALLATTLFNTVLAANPVYVFGAIAKIPLQYLVSCAISTGVFAVYIAGSLALADSLGGRDLGSLMLMNSLSAVFFLYAAIVIMHQLGAVYHRNRSAIGWFRD